ncbi:MAG: FG-GAP-like repeat-containing protein, partial [Arenimonas sp.]
RFLVDMNCRVDSGKSGALLWKRKGPAGALLGTGLEAAGDVNGDGVPDVVAGAPGINAVFVYSGRDGAQLYRLFGDASTTDLGAAVAGIGDFNGDGRSDFVAGAPSGNSLGANTGRVIVFSGKDGSRLLTLDGAAAGDGFGSTVGGADGRYFIIGAQGAGPQHRGRVSVYDHLAKTPAFVADADATGAALGAMFVSVVGDVDADGTPDIYATDFANAAMGPSTGRTYVYSGKTGQTLRVFTGDKAGEGFGIGAGRTGDVNGDGYADLVIGSWQYSGAAWSGGRVRVFSGKDGSTLQTFTGRVPGETLGFDAVGVGDIDGDGTTDYLLTSAWSMVNGLRSGRTFIVAGKITGASAPANR